MSDDSVPRSANATADSSPLAVYTDGGCDPNPGPGGWGAIIRWDEQEWVLQGNARNTTNNRMELTAAAAALAALTLFDETPAIELHTDSRYLQRGVTEWLENWAQNGWETSNGSPVKNQDLWRALHRLILDRDIHWNWLKGHAGHRQNERADQLATEARVSLQRRSQALSPQQPAASRQDYDVELFVKSSYSGKSKHGGWAVVMRWGHHESTLTGSAKGTSANAMLIRGAAEALNKLSRPCNAIIYSDAKYLIQGGASWVKGWLANGWRTRSGGAVANQEEWQRLLQAAEPHQVAWRLLTMSDKNNGTEAPEVDQTSRRLREDLQHAAELAAAATKPSDAS